MEVQIVNPLTNTGAKAYVSDNCLADYRVDSWGDASDLNGTTEDFGPRCFDWKQASGHDG